MSLFKKSLLIVMIPALALGGMAFVNHTKEKQDENGLIHWISFEEAVELNKKEKRKMFIDFYTSWCGWCKRMDVTTFRDPEVVKYMNENFYAVKFDAEQKDSLVYNEHVFKYRDDVGSRGIHEFALSALNGRPSYPSFVFFDEEINRITIVPGYRDASSLESMLNWINDNKYMSQPWDKYHQEFVQQKKTEEAPVNK
ncbi:MAG: DUF255 domain-containing protein [Flavobacteriales bacterium]|nr:DUF255 domain-containing protein [Flavobacteriales bacterium]